MRYYDVIHTPFKPYPKQRQEWQATQYLVHVLIYTHIL